MKTCKKCGVEKKLSDFYKDGRSPCRACYRGYQKKRRLTEVYKKYRASGSYMKSQKEYHKKYDVKYRGCPKFKEHRKSKEYAEAQKKYRASEKARLKRNEYNRSEKAKESHRKRYGSNVQFKLACLLRRRLLSALKRNRRVGSGVKDLGCSIEELKVYLEKQFKDGMSWENHGEWHIDHIKPLSKHDLTKRSQVLKACHYSNLQPLWKFENLSKGTG